MIDEKIKAKILHLLIYKRRIIFYDFWDSEDNSNKFIYYLDLLYNLNQLL